MKKLNYPLNLFLVAASAVIAVVVGLQLKRATREISQTQQPSAVDEPADHPIAETTSEASTDDVLVSNLPVPKFDQEFSRDPADEHDLKQLSSTEQQSLWAAFAKAQHKVREVPTAWQDREDFKGYDHYTLNPGQHLHACFGQGGMKLKSTIPSNTKGVSGESEAWSLTIDLLSLNDDPVMKSSVPVAVGPDKDRVEYAHGSGVTEWYVNRPEGLEHGYTIAARPTRPEGSERVTVGIGLDGLYAAEKTDESGNSYLTFQNDEQQDVLCYDKLLVFDADGQELPASMEPTQGGLLIAYNDTGARYPVTIDPLITSEEAKLNADDSGDGDWFGYSVSISGNTAVIGARYNNDAGNHSGSAYVFFFNSVDWFEQQKLVASDAAADDEFGYAVAVSGDTVVVGAHLKNANGIDSGKAYVYSRTGNQWSEEGTLLGADTTANDRFGYSVSVSGDTVVVGAYLDDDVPSSSGSAYVFVRSGGVWSQQMKLTASDAASGDQFGTCVSVDGDTAIIGAPFNDDDGGNSGSAYIFFRSGTNWSEQQKLIASDDAPGDNFGNAVAISGEYAVVGSYFDDDTADQSGSAYVFMRSGSSWSEQDKLTASDPNGNDQFGTSVAISGDRVIVGSPLDDDVESSSGSAYVFLRDGVNWNQEQKLTSGTPGSNDRMGQSVGISGDKIIVGAYRDDDFGADAGIAYYFRYQSPNWNQIQRVSANDTYVFDSFGYSVSISGETVIIGVIFDDDVFFDSGSAYIFVRNGTTWSEEAKLVPEDALSSMGFGGSVDISGDTAIIGASLAILGQGRAYIYVRNGDTWSQQKLLLPMDTIYQADRFGYAVGISGDTAVLSAPASDDDKTNSGSVIVYERIGSNWSHQATLTASSKVEGADFGFDLDFSGDVLVVGAPSDLNLGNETGAAYVFRRNGMVWGAPSKLTASDGESFDDFGRSVAISGNTVVVGAYKDTLTGLQEGSAYVFVYNGVTWSEQAKLTALDAGSEDQFAYSVSISGDTVAVGANRDNLSSADEGSVYVFTRNGTSWTQSDKITASDAEGGDRFGFDVSISGDTIVVGALGEQSSEGFQVGSVYIYRIAEDGAPNLIVRDHLAGEVPNGSTATPLPAQETETTQAYTYSLYNTGSTGLDITSITLGGTDASQFSLTLPDLSSNPDLFQAQSIDFTLNFNPTGASGLREANLVVFSNDLLIPVYVVNIEALALSSTTDSDGDGLSDWSEHLLRGFGLDWEESQPELVANLQSFIDSEGLLTEAEVGGVAGQIGIYVDPNTNTAKLTIGIEDSDDLETFTPHFVDPGDLSVNGNGEIEYDLGVPEGKKFYRGELK